MFYADAEGVSAPARRGRASERELPGPSNGESYDNPHRLRAAQHRTLPPAIDGVEAFTRLNPDMVLVEAMIPKKHGFEVCQELKRTPHGRRTPIIITTG